MKLHALLQTTNKSKKRIGRGLGSGKGKTGGRGTKGQKARGGVPLGFIGGTLPLYKKLPFRRGFGNSKKTIKMIPLAISRLDSLPANTTVDLQTLIKFGLVKERDAKKLGVKIINNGEINKKLTIMLPISASAARKIEKIGGKIVRA